MKRYNDDDNNPAKWWIRILSILFVIISCCTLISLSYLVYKIIVGVYHLLDKLIDKI